MNTDALIVDLGHHLRPVRRLAPPLVWVAAWLLIVAAAGMALSFLWGTPDLVARLLSVPDMWLAVLGSVLTTATAAAAAVLVSLPDRSTRWAWLPVPPLLLWQGANGFGCLRAPLHGLPPANFLTAADECLPFILMTSLPLAVVLLILLRRTASLRPELTTLMGGLAVASAAASLLWLFHDFDAGLSDLLVHAAAVALVIAAIRLVGPGLFRVPRRR